LVFLYSKATKSSIKYPVFIKTSKIFKIKKCLLLSENFLKISLKILLIFLHLFYQSGLIFGCILYRKDTNPVLKYPVFVKTSKKYIITKKMFCFHAYGLVSPIYIYINIITSYFHTTKEI